MTLKLLDRSALCQYLGVAKDGKAIRRIRADPAFPAPVPVGGRKRWIQKAVDDYLIAKQRETERALYAEK